MPEANNVPTTIPPRPHRGAPRFMPYEGSHMSPELNRGDFLLVMPVDRFDCDGLYIIDVLGVPVVYRCASNCNIRNPKIEVFSDPKFGRFEYTREQFSEMVIAQVVATCNMHNPHLLDGLADYFDRRPMQWTAIN